jgi:hypothetical protein
LISGGMWAGGGHLNKVKYSAILKLNRESMLRRDRR